MAISWTLACWWGRILRSKITLGQCIEVSFRGRCWDGLAEGFCVGPPVWGQCSQWSGARTDVVLGGRWGSSIVQWYSQQLSCCIFCTCTPRTFYCREWGSLGTFFFSSFFFWCWFLQIVCLQFCLSFAFFPLGNAVLGLVIVLIWQCHSSSLSFYIMSL